MTKIERVTSALLGWAVVLWLTSAELVDALRLLVRHVH